MEDIYQKLRERLDELSIGYPETESRVEIKILKKLFTEEEAAFFLELSPMLEKPEDVAKRLDRDPAETERFMEEMAKKGLLFRQRKGDMVRYAAAPYVVGIFEYQVNTIDRELAEDFEEYYETAFGKRIQSLKTPLMRSIPINKELVAKWPVAPSEDVMDLLDKQETIAIAPCICRTTTHLVDKGCDKTMHNCFMFGSHARYYVENGMGKYITREEAKEIVKQNDEEGLVMQPFNSEKAGGMCSCCGDCCGMLRSLKLQPVPAASVQSNYFAAVEQETCIGCETCLERCQMDAIYMEEEKAMINLDRCIGCGLCVTTCPSEALSLERKPEEQLYEPPKSGAETYMRLALERGKNPLAKH